MFIPSNYRYIQQFVVVVVVVLSLSFTLFFFFLFLVFSRQLDFFFSFFLIESQSGPERGEQEEPGGDFFFFLVFSSHPTLTNCFVVVIAFRLSFTFFSFFFFLSFHVNLCVCFFLIEPDRPKRRRTRRAGRRVFLFSCVFIPFDLNALLLLLCLVCPSPFSLSFSLFFFSRQLFLKFILLSQTGPEGREEEPGGEEHGGARETLRTVGPPARQHVHGRRRRGGGKLSLLGLIINQSSLSDLRAM